MDGSGPAHGESPSGGEPVAAQSANAATARGGASRGSAASDGVTTVKSVTLVEGAEYIMPSEAFHGDSLDHRGSLRSEGEDLPADGAALVDNAAAQALTEMESRTSSDFHTCLEELGIRFNEDEPSHSQDDAPSSSGSCGADGHRPICNSRNSDVYLSDRSELAILRSLFKPNSKRYVLRDTHVNLGRVLQHIFCDYANETMTRQTSKPLDYTKRLPASFLAFVSRLRPPTRLRAMSRRVISNWSFSLLFLTLTLYSLFSTDLVVLYGTKEIDEPFLIVNSVVFLLFFIELILQALAVEGYLCTMPFVLDLTALLSILGDTWFMRQGSLLSSNEEASRLSRMARTSKMTRLARIARVARITKLVPELMRFLRTKHKSLARQVLQRRLWRVFCFLDADEDGMLSPFDVKAFYITVMQECPHMLYRTRFELLSRDVPALLAALGVEDDMSPCVTFDMFQNFMHSSEMGASLDRFHLEDVEQESGMWTLTQRLSDKTALKVCVGILVLIVTLSFLEVMPEDRNAQVSLAQLTTMAEIEHARGDSANTTYLCEQVDHFVQSLLEPAGHKVLFLYLDGARYYVVDEAGVGQCSPTPDTAVDPVHRAREIRESSSVRAAEFSWVVFRAVVQSDSNTTRVTSATLIDQSFQEKDISKWAVITILSVILLLLIFVYVLHAKINMFSGNLLQPLRSLVDDMMAMSCLELVHVDKDLPAETVKPLQVTEELQDLQAAFKGMRSAIRSWSKYVPPCVVERLYSSGIEATVGVARSHTTILFAAIASFEETCASLSLSPGEVLLVLSNVYSGISDCIQKHRGVLLEFIGDEVLAVFNAPNKLKHHAFAGLRTAQDIHNVVNGAVQVTTASGQGVVIRCQCGVHTAHVLAGNIGSYKRMKYGLLGDGVNLAARLKGLNSRYSTQTLCSGNALFDESHTQDLLLTRPVDKVAVKGKSEPTIVHEVMEHPVREEWLRTAAKTHAEAFDLYQARLFQAAQAKFMEVSWAFEKAGQKDEPSRLLSGRCAAYLLEPPPADWDGVDRLKHKSFALAPAPSSSGSAMPFWQTAATSQLMIAESGQSMSEVSDSELANLNADASTCYCLPNGRSCCATHSV